MNIGTPPAEHEIDEELVRRILRDQHPDFADAPISLVDVGWDNAMYRVGETDVVRLPRRELAATLMENEQTWLPLVARSLPLPVPIPKRVGQPTEYYPSWDSPHNKKLIEKMPDVYSCRSLDPSADRLKPGFTTFLAPVGEQTIFGGAKATVRLAAESSRPLLPEPRPSLGHEFSNRLTTRQQRIARRRESMAQKVSS